MKSQLWGWLLSNLKLKDLYNFEIAKLMYQFTHNNYLSILIIILLIHVMFHPILPATPQAMTFFTTIY